MSEQPQPECSPANQLKLWIRAGVRTIAVLTLLGLMLRLTIRDSLIGLATLYYMTPLALLMIGSGICLLHTVVTRRRVQIIFWGLLCAGTSIWWTQAQWLSRREPTTENREIVVLFANVARTGDYRSTSDVARKLDADIIGMVEATGTLQELVDHWKSELPDYDLSILGNNIQIFTKGTSGDGIPRELGKDSHMRHIPVVVDGVEIQCLLVDIAANIFGSRGPAIEQLTNYAEQLDDQNVLIMGDFNTPLDSVHFRPLKRQHRNAFATAGDGYMATWPAPLPVLSLDQIWTNKRLKPIYCKNFSNSNSDHQIVWARLRLESK